MITSTTDDVFLIMPTCEISQETFEKKSLYFILFEKLISNQWKGVTIRDLLSHRVCLTDTDVNLVLGSKNDTREEFAFTRRFLTKQCDFRTKYKVLRTKILFVFIDIFYISFSTVMLCMDLQPTPSSPYVQLIFPAESILEELGKAGWRKFSELSRWIQLFFLKTLFWIEKFTKIRINLLGLI